jgi:hypothetical protein
MSVGPHQGIKAGWQCVVDASKHQCVVVAGCLLTRRVEPQGLYCLGGVGVYLREPFICCCIKCMARCNIAGALHCVHSWLVVRCMAPRGWGGREGCAPWCLWWLVAAEQARLVMRSWPMVVVVLGPLLWCARTYITFLTRVW